MKLNDIKPIVEIPTNSIYIYYTIAILSFILIVFIIYLIVNYFKNNNQSDKKLYINTLKQIDFKDTKKSAYTISKYGNLLKLDDRQKQLFDDLNATLEIFKYKKDVSLNITNNIKTKYDIFIDSLDV
jgi:hypothetical protein